MTRMQDVLAADGDRPLWMSWPIRTSDYPSELCDDGSDVGRASGIYCSKSEQ